MPRNIISANPHTGTSILRVHDVLNKAVPAGLGNRPIPTAMVWPVAGTEGRRNLGTGPIAVVTRSERGLRPGLGRGTLGRMAEPAAAIATYTRLMRPITDRAARKSNAALALFPCYCWACHGHGCSSESSPTVQNLSGMFGRSHRVRPS